MLAIAVPSTWAAAVPGYAVGADAGYNKFDVTGRHLFDFGTIDYANPLHAGQLHFESSGTPSPSLRATAEMGPTAVELVNGFVSGVLLYHVQITGPAGPVQVMIDASGHAEGFANAGAAFEVKAFWALRNASGFNLASDTIEAIVFDGSFDQSFGHTTEVMLDANTDYVVFMSVFSRAYAQVPGSHAFVESFVDPIFRFGPGADPSLYAFEFSAGIGNGSPVGVPEPGAAVLVLLGLLTLAARRAGLPHRRERPQRGARA